MSGTILYDPELRAAVERAVERLWSDLSAAAPYLASLVRTWTSGLAGGHALSDYFTHDDAFPTLLLPWWLDSGLAGAPDRAFHEDLAYSTINGYLYVRTVDNLMDGDDSGERRLLPAIAWFHSQFQLTYQRYFEHDHPFWRAYASVWFHAAEATAVDAAMTSIDRDGFLAVTAQKVSAAKIPVAAVCHRRGCLAHVDDWYQVIDRLGAFHQMLNDVFDWHGDQARGRPTFFLSEGGRRLRPGESLDAWVAREGFDWGVTLLTQWLTDLDRLAVDLGSADLAGYLVARRRRLAVRRQDVADGLAQLQRLTAVVRPRRPGA